MTPATYEIKQYSRAQWFTVLRNGKRVISFANIHEAEAWVDERERGLDLTQPAKSAA